MSITAVHTLLDARLATITGLPPLQKENTRYEPKSGVAWTRSTIIPTQTQRLSSEKDMLNGLYQVDVFYPTDKGNTTASTMADTVIAAFNRGLVLTGTGIEVHIVMCWRETSQSFQQFYQLPIVVSWNSEVSRA